MSKQIMIGPSEPPPLGVKVLRMYGCHFETSTITFLKSLTVNKKNDILIDEDFITVHRETILTNLNDAPNYPTWNEMETIWEFLDHHGMDFLEVPADLCCPNPDCVNRKHNI